MSHVADNTGQDALPGRKLADMQVIQSTKLANVCYEIRGPVLEEAMRLEAAGHRILKLNTGNPAALGFECPPEILEDILRNTVVSSQTCRSSSPRSSPTSVTKSG